MFKSHKVPTFAQSLALGALASVAFVIWRGSVGMWLPLSIAGFGLFWGLATRRIGWIAALALWVPGVHLAMWVPMLLTANLTAEGQPLAALFGTLVTSTAVAWYMLSSFPFLTVIAGLFLLSLIGLIWAIAGARA